MPRGAEGGERRGGASFPPLPECPAQPIGASGGWRPPNRRQGWPQGPALGAGLSTAGQPHPAAPQGGGGGCPSPGAAAPGPARRVPGTQLGAGLPAPASPAARGAVAASRPRCCQRCCQRSRSGERGPVRQGEACGSCGPPGRGERVAASPGASGEGVSAGCLGAGVGAPSGRAWGSPVGL